MSAPDYRRGAAAAAEASKSASFARTPFFKLKDGESAIVRILTPADEWISVDQHQMVPTKPKPDDFKGENWPERIGAVCRNDEAFATVYDGCYICEFLVPADKAKAASSRVWALAVLREEVKEEGKVVGFKDIEREVLLPAREAKGDLPARPEQTVVEKAVVIMNLGYRNFFSILEGFAGRWGTVGDRDYYITRKGSDQSTTYAIVPEEPINDKDGNRLDPATHPDRWPTSMNLADLITERSDDEFYARFFDPRVTTTEDGEVTETGAEAPKPDSDVPAEKLAALSERVRDWSGSTAPEGNGETQEAQEEKATESAGSGLVDLG